LVHNETRILRVARPIECVILKRVNRFVVDILVKGEPQRAYLNNTGRLTEYMVEGNRGFCIKTEKARKTDCQIFSVREDALAAIIDTRLQMKAFEKALGMGLIPWARKCGILRRNAKLGTSLIDYLLERSGRTAYLEVKSAVLREGKYAMYPDCPSLRGRRHMEELTTHVRKGGKATLLFLAALPGVKAFRLNESADPELCRLLREACSGGVDVRSIAMCYNPEDSFVYLLNPNLRVNVF